MLMIYGEQIENITSNCIVRKILINKDNELSLFSYGLLIGASYVLGLIINWFRDLAQFNWFYNKTNQKSKYRENVKDYWKKVKEFNKATKDSPDMADYFERMIVMFQVTGNFALTIILCLISLLIWDLTLCKLTIIVPVGFVIAYFSKFKFEEHITYLEEEIKERCCPY